MSEKISRFGVSVEDELLQSFDQLIAAKGYETRSGTLRDLMRDAPIKSKLAVSAENGEVIGNLTLVYDHHASDLTDKMDDLQHERHELIMSVLHIHINHDNCMEVIVPRGEIKDVHSLAESLLSLKGVKHGKLFVTLPANKITGAKPGRNGHHHKH